MKCSICKKEIRVEASTGWKKGHNAEPVNSGRCCSECNEYIVIPARIKNLVTVKN